MIRQVLEEVKVMFEVMKGEQLSSGTTFAEFCESAPLFWHDRAGGGGGGGAGGALEWFSAVEMVDPRYGLSRRLSFRFRLTHSSLHLTVRYLTGLFGLTACLIIRPPHVLSGLAPWPAPSSLTVCPLETSWHATRGACMYASDHI
jgi:hypothetical protein